MSRVLYRLYRPSTFKEVCGQEHVVQTIQNQHASGTLAHAYMFSGPRGVGKTTLARLVAKLANCESPAHNEPCNRCAACSVIASGQSLDLYEIDAASHTDVEHVREGIIKSVRFAPNQLRKKVYIIDEVHMLSASAFNALLKTLEEPPDHVLFVLATTEIHKVPETIISRCQRFDFKRIPQGELVKRMQGIVKEEGVSVDEEVLREVARHSEGCARDAESLLGQILALGEKKVGMKEASLVLPATNAVLVEEFTHTLRDRQASEAIRLLNTYLEQGVDLHHFVSDVIRWLRDRLLESVSQKSQAYEMAFLEQSIEEFLAAARSIGGGHIPQLPVELAIVRICGVTPPLAEPAPSQDFQQQEVDSGREKKEGKGQMISLDEVRKKWPVVYEQIKSCNTSLPLMMTECEVCGVEGEHVELGFEYELYVETVNQEKNRRLIEAGFEKVLGKRLLVKAVQIKHANEKDETVQTIIKAFGGNH